MKSRPRIYTLVSIILVGIAIGIPVQVMWNYELSLGEIDRAFSYLPLLNLFLMLSLTIQAAMTWNSNRLLLVVAPLNLLVLIYNNYLVGRWGYDYSMAETWIASGAFLAFQCHLLLPPFYKPLKDPKIRWWMVPVRRAIEVPVRVSPVLGNRFHSFTMDMSETGAFIESQTDSLAIGDEIDICFSANSVKPLQIQAEVVRKGENQRQDRSEFGYGVRFQQLNSNQKKTLDKFLGTH